MDLKFRDLTADEIECRIASAKDNGMSLLLYKDARCDMNILDETVGAFNWQRSHSRENANCIVSIWDNEKGQWISKEDTGTESNTEAAKGLASDSFKRACFNWGIGRELYTAPFIWVKPDKYDGKYDKFEVQDIKIENKRITGLTIYNASKGCVAFTMGKARKSSSTEKKTTATKPEAEKTSEATAEVKPAEENHSPARQALSDFLKENKFTNEDKMKIITRCKLAKDSPDTTYMLALQYAKDMLEQKKRETRPADYGDVPFEV